MIAHHVFIKCFVVVPRRDKDNGRLVWSSETESNSTVRILHSTHFRHTARIVCLWRRVRISNSNGFCESSSAFCSSCFNLVVTAVAESISFFEFQSIACRSHLCTVNGKRDVCTLRSVYSEVDSSSTTDNVRSCVGIKCELESAFLNINKEVFSLHVTCGSTSYKAEFKDFFT